MIEESLRQKIFKFMDNNPNAENKDVYKEFPKERENSVRTYRRDYFKEKEKLISQVQVVSQKSISKIIKKSENILSHQELDKFSITHFFGLFHTFDSLPLFIYSKIHSIINEKYGRNQRNLPGNLDDTITNYNNWDFSFVKLFMEVINDICLEKYDSEISSYEGNSLQLFGNTLILELYDKEFKKEVLEERTYWSEERLEKHLTMLKEKGYYREGDDEYFRKRVTEGDYIADYEDEKDYIEECIEECFDQIEIWRAEYPGSNLKGFKSLRSKLLFLVFWDLFEYSEFINRSPAIMKEDIREMIMEYNLNNSDKKNFVEYVKRYNETSIVYNSDTMTVTIDRRDYIDLGQHGEEYLGLDDCMYKDPDTEEWKTKQIYFDKIEFS